MPTRCPTRGHRPAVQPQPGGQGQVGAVCLRGWGEWGLEVAWAAWGALGERTWQGWEQEGACQT